MKQDEKHNFKGITGIILVPASDTCCNYEFIYNILSGFVRNYEVT
jgi:hypothetical protein